MKPEKPTKNVRKAPMASPEKKAEVKPPLAAVNKSAAAKRRTRVTPPVPSILLEGDKPNAGPTPAGPGQKFALSPSVAGKPVIPRPPEELPEAYGTRRLLLAARDPHWLYAAWDLERTQQRQYNALSADRHLILRVYKDSITAKPLSEVHVHPESRNWFINVGQGGTRYLAELGYYQKNGKWVTITTSGATLTPPDQISEDVSVWFETLPADVKFEQLLDLVKSAAAEHVPLLEAIQHYRAAGKRRLPTPKAIAAGTWTKEQEQALAQLLSMDSVRRIWIGSLEVTELIRRQWQEQISSITAAQFSQPGPGPAGALPFETVTSISSPFGGVPRRRKFWINVNAELIIYGATEPDAEVKIGGRTIKLRSDGTFSYRFALPDGNYELPIAANSADHEEQRSAWLAFSRRTEYQGDVGKHPQDETLQTPRPENVS